MTRHLIPISVVFLKHLSALPETESDDGLSNNRHSVGYLYPNTEFFIQPSESKDGVNS